MALTEQPVLRSEGGSLTVRMILVRLLSALLIAIAGFSTFAQHSPQPAPLLPDISDVQKRQASFELVWKTVNESFYDPAFAGVDWRSVRERYAPLAARAKTDQELHLVLQQMLNELHQSHFM